MSKQCVVCGTHDTLIRCGDCGVVMCARLRPCMWARPAHDADKAIGP